MVGFLPLCASTVFEADAATRYPKLTELILLFKKRHPDVLAQVAPEGILKMKKELHDTGRVQ